MDCIFCKIINGDFPSCKVFEDNDFAGILDIMPINLGHTLLIPKKHFRNIFDTPDDFTDKIYRVLKHISCGIKQALDCDGLNIIQNIEKAAGQEVFHSHIHIVPRYTDDAFSLNLKKKKYANDEDMIKFAKKIANYINKCEMGGNG